MSSTSTPSFERQALRALLCLPHATVVRGQRGVTQAQLAAVVSDKEESPDDRCEVCGFAECDSFDPIIFCECCNACVHQRCYGVTTLPAGDWVCRQCEALVPLHERRCELCPSTIGAMKRTTTRRRTESGSGRSRSRTTYSPTPGDGWVHLVCALHHPSTEIVDATRKEPVVIGRIAPERSALKCEVCHQRGGAPTQCAWKSCRKAFHCSCAIQAQLRFRWHVTMEEVKQTRTQKGGRKRSGGSTKAMEETVHLQVRLFLSSFVLSFSPSLSLSLSLANPRVISTPPDLLRQALADGRASGRRDGEGSAAGAGEGAGAERGSCGGEEAEEEKCEGKGRRRRRRRRSAGEEEGPEEEAKGEESGGARFRG
jgi:hypothetical protein